MTINVTLVTNEALVLGCDSIASTSEWLVDPMKILKRDQFGQYVRDESGKLIASFDWPDMRKVVTNAWGGVQKMFPVYKTGSPGTTDFACVAAVTSGLATLQDRTMHSLALEFSRLGRRAPLSSVEEIGTKFMNFIYSNYQLHNQALEVPEEFRDDIEFLIGGYGQGDDFPTAYRVSVKNRSLGPIFGPRFEKHSGVAWGGQNEAVNRLLFGYDATGMEDAQRIIDKLHEDMSNTVARILNETLAALGEAAPSDVNMELPAKPAIADAFSSYTLDIDYANMPLQYGVEFVSYLVNQESGKQKFVRGVPTVGGRTHIGFITRADGFVEVNKPELKHRHVGYHRD